MKTRILVELKRYLSLQLWIVAESVIFLSAKLLLKTISV